MCKYLSSEVEHDNKIMGDTTVIDYFMRDMNTYADVLKDYPALVKLLFKEKYDMMPEVLKDAFDQNEEKSSKNSEGPVSSDPVEDQEMDDEQDQEGIMEAPTLVMRQSLDKSKAVE